jgi:hypothetical protein
MATDKKTGTHLKKQSLHPRKRTGPDSEYGIHGCITFAYGEPASKLKLLASHRGIGGETTLVGEGRTDGTGRYALKCKSSAPLNVTIYTREGERDVPLSRNVLVTGEVELNLVAPTSLRPPKAEFSRLIAAVGRHIAPENLAGIMEGRGRRDVSLLASLTGWDARHLALAATAFSTENATRMSAEALYGLYRSGFPTQPRRLAQTTVRDVTAALERAAAVRVVEPGAVKDGMEAFSLFAARMRIESRLPSVSSSLRDFVHAARIPKAEEDRFLAALAREPSADFWVRAEADGVSKGSLEQLQLQGKLGYLTLHHLGLASRLQEILTAAKSQDPRDLIDHDFDRAERWKTEILLLSGNDVSTAARQLPTFVGGKNAADRIDAYAGELASRVRAMAPPRVTARSLERGDFAAVPESERADASVLLKTLTTRGYELGRRSLSAFTEHLAEANLSPARLDRALGHVKTLHRLYSISPTDDALNRLMHLGFTSATKVAAVPRADFVSVASETLGSVSVARQIHQRARRVADAARGVLFAAKRLPRIVGVRRLTGKAEQHAASVARATAALTRKFPSLDEVFGSVDFCECDDCRSVLSPAAYYVDLLHFLDPSDSDWSNAMTAWGTAHAGADYAKSGYLKPFDALALRRADLPLIPLTCENTNTELPYIDLVNELLETEVLRLNGNAGAVGNFDTADSQSADLIAEPEHINWDAYVLLAKAVYPRSLARASFTSSQSDSSSPPGQTLPFDVPLETLRGLLSLVNLTVLELRESFAYSDRFVGDANRPGLLDVWHERLKLCETDVNVLTGRHDWFALYGYVTEQDALQGVAAPGKARDPSTSLRNAKTLATRLGTTYAGLVDLLRTTFVNTSVNKRSALHKLGLRPELVDGYLKGQTSTTFAAELGQAKRRYPTLDDTWLKSVWSEAVQQSLLVLEDSAESSDFSAVTLKFALSPAAEPAAMALALSRMNLFVRLRDRLGWPNGDLDAVLGAFLPADVTGDAIKLGPAMGYALNYIAHLTELAEVAGPGVTTQELATLWSPMPTMSPSSLYARLFLDSALLAQDTVFDDPIGGYLQSSDSAELLSAHATAIRQALQLSSADIDLVLSPGTDGVDVVKGTTPSAPSLTLGNLSRLLRFSVLARALGIKIADLSALLSLSARAPMTTLGKTLPATPDDDVPFAETIPFVKDVTRLATFGFDATRLNALCRANPTASDRDATDLLVGQLFIAVAGIVSAKEDAPDVRLRTVRAIAAARATTESLTNALLTDTTLLRADGGGAVLDSLIGGPTPGFTDAGTSDTAAPTAVVVFPAPGNYTFSLSGDQTATVQITLGTSSDTGEWGSLTLDPRAASTGTFKDLQPGILYTLSISDPNADVVISGDHLPSSSIAVLSPKKYDCFDAFSKALQLFLVAVDVMSAFGFDERTYRSVPGALDLSTIPVNPPEAASKVPQQVFAGLAGLADVASTATALNVSPGMVVEAWSSVGQGRIDAAGNRGVLVGGALGALFTKSSIAKTRAKQVLALIAPPSTTGTGAFLKLADLRRFVRLVRFSTALDLDPVELQAWSLSGVGAATARNAHAVVKALFSKDSWRTIARPIYDALRRERRDALVAYLTAAPQAPYTTEEELYEYLLVDPGSEPALLTSRLKLAISSVQIFVQRCLMNFELTVPPDIIGASRWAWMSRESLWEANRKIFLWPENWLDPALRDDKTPLFNALESTLLQGDSSVDAVEGALKQYLQGLEMIARLEMMTMYREQVASGPLVIHVIGRTQNAPHQYYYRKSVDGMWTPWQPCQLGINGDHLVLTPWHDRLHLFWVTFVPQSAGRDPTKMGDLTNPAPVTFGDFAKTPLNNTKPTQTVRLQLDWAEQFGEIWGNHASTGPIAVSQFDDVIDAYADIDIDRFFVHAVKQTRGADASAQETLEVHVSCVDGPAVKFVLAGKSASASIQAGAPPTGQADLSAPTPRATKWQGTKSLVLDFNYSTTADVTAGDIPSVGSYPLLRRCPGSGVFRVLFPSNPPSPLQQVGFRPPAGKLVGCQQSYAAADPAAARQVQYITYRGVDGHIYEVWGEGLTATNESRWYQTDVTQVTGAVAAASDPAATAAVGSAAVSPHYSTYSTTDYATRSLAFVGTDGHLLWVFWDVKVGWSVTDLTETYGTGDLAIAGSPVIVYEPRVLFIYYRDTVGSLFVMYYGWDEYFTGWKRSELACPAVASDLSAYSLGVNRFVVYRDTQDHVQFVYFTYAGVNASAASVLDLTKTLSLTTAVGNVVLALAHEVVTSIDLAVVYRSQDGSLQLALCSSSVYTNPIKWRAAAVPGPAAAGELAVWVEGPSKFDIDFGGDGTWIHIAYRTSDDTVVEVWEDSAGWHSRNVTAEANAPVAIGDPTAYRFDRAGVFVIAYECAPGGLCALQRTPTGNWTSAGPMPLVATNLAPTDAEQINTPFFYEDDLSTFYVEPHLSTTLAHEWRDYVATVAPASTNQPLPIAAHFPEARDIDAPHSLAMATPPSTDWLFAHDAVLRTPHGVVASSDATPATRPTVDTGGGAVLHYARKSRRAS